MTCLTPKEYVRLGREGRLTEEHLDSIRICLLVDALNLVLASATPTERDNPAMYATWKHARNVLSRI